MALINFLKKKKEQIDKAIPDLNVKQRAGQAVQKVGQAIKQIETGAQQAGGQARRQVNRAAPAVTSFVKEAPKQIAAGLLRSGAIAADTGVRALQKAEDIATAPLGSAYRQRLQNLRNIQSARENQILQGLKPLEQKKSEGLQNYLKGAYNLALPEIKSVKQATPLQRGAAIADIGLTLLAPGAGTAIKQTGKQGLKQIAKQYGKTALVQGAGGAAGAATMKDATASDIAKGALAGAVFGTGLKGAGDITRVATPAITKQVSKAGQKVQTALEQPKFQPGFASTKPKVGIESKQPSTIISPYQKQLQENVNKDIQASKTFQYKYNVNDKVKFKSGDGNIKNAIITSTYLENGTPRYTVRVPSSNNSRIILKEQEVINPKQPKTEAPKSAIEALSDPEMIKKWEKINAMQKGKKVTKTSNNLYHTTPATNLESIIKKGLTTGNKPRFEGVSGKNKIYFSANEKGANYYGNKNDIMIRTKSTYKPDDLEIDLLGGGEGTYMTGKNIPPEMLEVKINNKWTPITKLPKTEAPVVKLATTEPKQPKIIETPEQLAQKTIQSAIKEPISPEIAPVARVSTKVEPKVSPEPKIEAKKVIETSIDPSDPFGNRNIINQIKNELGSLGDRDYKMVNVLKKIEKETGAKGLVDQFEFDTGNIRASKAMANAKIRQSQELSDALSGLNKKQAQNFDEYVKARAELENYTPEMKTSKPREELARIVAAGDAEFADRFSSINQYYKNMAQDMYDGGLIDRNTLNRYLADDNYVRLQRDVEDLVGAMPGKSGSRSIRTTTAKQRRTGSERELLSPTQSLLKRTQQIELEIQRNKAANNIIDTLVEYGLATPVKQSKNKNTIARLVNGKKELFEVNGEIKQIIDNVSPYNLGVLARIISAPTRVFRAGTTALSAPFSALNYLKDQASSAIYSKNTLVTHNPVNIITGLSNAITDQVKGSKNPLWKKFERYIGDQTVYDELRNAANSNRLLREAREGQIGRIKNAILDPIRTLEDINSITEKATRFQNFEGIYKEAIKKGLSEQDAIREAVLAARRNSIDFNKGSDFTRVLSLFIPYFNASVQGTRNVVQAFAERPVRTALKSVGYVAIPSVLATAYNLADETRREAYNSIDDFEKENNFIVILPNAKQNEQGTWTGILKIPKAQGFRELTDPVREVTEAFMQQQPVEDVSKMFYDMLGAVSGPFNIQSPEKLLGSLIPQAIKPSIQAALNKDIFTGKQIVPQYMVEQTEDPTKRAYDETSGSSRLIAEQLGASPLQVEKFIKGTTGSVGQYVTDLVDRALANANIIPKEQIGGRSIIEDVKRRLTEASGELPESRKTPGRKYFESVNEIKKDLSVQDQKAWDTLHPTKTNFLGEEVFNENKRISKYTKAGIYLNNPNVLEADRKLNQLMVQKGNPSNPFFELPEPLQRQVLLKEALPPGSKDPMLSALYKEEWFQDYQKARSDYYDQIKANMAKQGKELPKSTNPYPTTPPELQKVMDYYSSLPKGTGARSKWIKANPGLWQQMTAQWQQVDAWENKERVAMGIPEIVQEAMATTKTGGEKGGRKRIWAIGEKRLSKTPKAKDTLRLIGLKSKPKLAAIKLQKTAKKPVVKLTPSRKAQTKKLTIRNIRVK